MNMEKTEKEVKQLFNELRAQDSQRAPSFNAVTRATPSVTFTGLFFSWSRFALGTTAFVLLTATIALTAIQLHARSVERERRQWKALSDWEAPTDAFLSISSVPWGSTITTPSDFLINNPAVPSDTTQKNL